MFNLLEDPTLVSKARDYFPTYSSNLNAEQQSCVDSPSQESLRILAPAGSGKTHTIINRAILLSLRDSIRPDRLACITFTRKASREMKERYVKFWQDCGLTHDLADVALPRFSTVHSMQYHCLKRFFGMNSTSILSEYQSYKLLSECVKAHFNMAQSDNSLISNIMNFKDALCSRFLQSSMFIPVFTTPNTFSHIELSHISTKGNINQIEYSVDYQDLYKKAQALSYPALIWRYSNPKSGRAEYDYILPQIMVREITALLLKYHLKSYGVQLRQTLSDYYTRKYTARTFDFSDMSYLFLLMSIQFPEFLANLHASYDALILDEAQDSPPSQIATMICLQNDLYNEFFNPLNISLEKGQYVPESYPQGNISPRNSLNIPITSTIQTISL